MSGGTDLNMAFVAHLRGEGTSSFLIGRYTGPFDFGNLWDLVVAISSRRWIAGFLLFQVQLLSVDVVRWLTSVVHSYTVQSMSLRRDST